MPCHCAFGTGENGSICHLARCNTFCSTHTATKPICRVFIEFKFLLCCMSIFDYCWSAVPTEHFIVFDYVFFFLSFFLLFVVIVIPCVTTSAHDISTIEIYAIFFTLLNARNSHIFVHKMGNTHHCSVLHWTARRRTFTIGPVRVFRCLVTFFYHSHDLNSKKMNRIVFKRMKTTNDENKIISKCHRIGNR